MKVLIMILALGTIWTRTSFPDDTLTPEEIVRAGYVRFYYAGNDMKARILMKLIDKGGQERIRDLTMLRKNYAEGGEQRYFIYFHQPSDVRDTTFMVYKHPDKDDDRWLFIPAIDLVKRIAANDKFSSFVGSDFTYEDISGRKPEEDTHALLKEEEVNGRNCFVIESTPGGRSEYTKKISWIDKQNFLPLKEEFYDKQDELYRQFEAQEIKDINGIPTIVKRVMKNVKTGHRTEVTFQDIAYNLGIEDDIFSERYLRKAPPQWIK
ncbi:MAG: outer membrane lipoprotein-sorting protein [Candidatus Omnitrophica bacterium]|nr:outer membrane lipoprotein-sorting protein [Candidatus Omnitrophota bacterium]